jgi:hypothetical protein
MTPVRATVIQQPTPLERLIEAMDWAARNGWIVDVGGEHGIRHGTICGVRRWLRLHSGGGYISPLGAVVLREQPSAVMMPEAAAEAMGVGVPWILGFEAGAARRDLSGHWRDGFSASVALAGYQAGVEVRAWILSVTCAKHPGTRYSRVGGVCPYCDIAEAHKDDEYPTHGAGGDS